MALNIDEFICSECEKQKITVEEQELYCLCKQPYDESKYVVLSGNFHYSYNHENLLQLYKFLWKEEGKLLFELPRNLLVLKYTSLT